MGEFEAYSQSRKLNLRVLTLSVHFKESNQDFNCQEVRAKHMFVLSDLCYVVRLGRPTPSRPKVQPNTSGTLFVNDKANAFGNVGDVFGYDDILNFSLFEQVSKCVVEL